MHPNLAQYPVSQPITPRPHPVHTTHHAAATSVIECSRMESFTCIDSRLSSCDLRGASQGPGLQGSAM
jgi:hypothetical protein